MNTAKPGLSFAKKLAIFLAVLAVIDVTGLVFLSFRFPSFWQQIMNRVHQDQTRLSQCNDQILRNPKNAQNYANRAEAYRNLLRRDLALNDYNKAISLAGGHADWYDQRAQLDESEAKAIADFSTAIRLDPDNGQYHVDRAQVYSSAKKAPEALADFQTALKLHCEPSTVFSARGQMYQDFGEMEKAIADYKQFLQVSNNDNAELSDVCPRLAKIYIARGDYKKALSVTSRWAKDDDIYTADDACNMQGKIYELLDRKDLADRQYKEAIAALDKKNLSFSGSGRLGFGIEKHGDLLFRLGDIAAAKSDWQRAIGAFEKGLNRSPSDGSTLDHSSIAKLYEKLGDRHKRDESYRLCIEDLDEKIRATPNDAENYHRRGEDLEELSEYPSALRDLQTAKRLDPESADSYDCDIARILLKENKIHEGLTAYLAAARTDQGAIVDEGLAQALELSGQHAKAVAAADRAINYDGDFGECYKWRAKACQSLGDKRGAATGFKIAEIFKGQ